MIVPQTIRAVCLNELSAASEFMVRCLPAVARTLGKKWPIEQNDDRNTPRDNDQQGKRKLNVAGDRGMSIFLQKRCSERAGRDTRQHRKPAIRNRQRPLVDEKRQSTNARDKRPCPSRDPNSHQPDFPHMTGHFSVRAGRPLPRSA